MKEIPLTQGLVALVDDDDYEILVQYKWRTKRKKTNIYAITTIDTKIIYMHRLIISVPPDMVTDHRDGNGLNNQRVNLRICTIQENVRNRRKSKSTKQNNMYKGVYASHPSSTYYYASICVNYKNISLGCFRDPVEAARAYDTAARKYFGEYARLNFPD